MKSSTLRLPPGARTLGWGNKRESPNLVGGWDGKPIEAIFTNNWTDGYPEKPWFFRILKKHENREPKSFAAQEAILAQCSPTPL